jgi:hypothetical protein
VRERECGRQAERAMGGIYRKMGLRSTFSGKRIISGASECVSQFFCSALSDSAEAVAGPVLPRMGSPAHGRSAALTPGLQPAPSACFSRLPLL